MSESGKALNAEAGAVDPATSVGAHTSSSLSSSLVLSSSSLRTLVEQWRKEADRAAADADAHEGDSAGNSHAFRKERRIWTTCADELAALLYLVEKEKEELAEANRLLGITRSVLSRYENESGAIPYTRVVKDFAHLALLSPVEVEETHEDTDTRTGDDGLSTSFRTASTDTKG